MTDKAAHVTMLQRSPTYVMSLPATDGIAERLLRVLPQKTAYAIARWKNVLMALFFYHLCKRWSQFGKKVIRKGAIETLPLDYSVDIHFKPRYRPWEQRLCVVPDGDLFKAISHGRASVVTDSKNPNFTKVAEAIGAKGIRIEEPGDVREGLAAALSYKSGPVVLDAVAMPMRFRCRRMFHSTWLKALPLASPSRY